MTCHHVSVYVLLAMVAVQAPDAPCLADKVFARGTLFGRVKFVNSDDQVPKRPGLRNEKTRSKRDMSVNSSS
ncbi:hypothetical protein BKA57DRAFT_471576 [Linnemannia elongata]|nr:hypothetical protein BKA57DRAFT_479853 [Linnemannia elongata]KAH7043145.1 hypothetical protein BKA57DRAFT_471576 [Linnemannia elongata]